MKKKILFTVILGIVLSYFGYNYIYQDHRDIASEESIYYLDSNTFYEEFSIDPSSSEQKYLNKTITVSGEVSQINYTSIVLNDHVFCQLLKGTDEKSDLNSQIIIKGRFIGYDDLLEQIKLDQCSIINKH